MSQKMQPIDDRKETATFRAVSRDEEGRKRVERVEVVDTQQIDTLKHIEKKLIDKGIHRKDRQPGDGLAKSGHGGKYTWEGPAASEMEEAPAVLDENDPNYVDEEAEDTDGGGERREGDGGRRGGGGQGGGGRGGESRR